MEKTRDKEYSGAWGPCEMKASDQVASSSCICAMTFFTSLIDSVFGRSSSRSVSFAKLLLRNLEKALPFQLSCLLGWTSFCQTVALPAISDEFQFCPIQKFQRNTFRWWGGSFPYRGILRNEAKQLRILRSEGQSKIAKGNKDPEGKERKLKRKI